MEDYKIILGVGSIASFVLFTGFSMLDGVHHMAAIEKHAPWIYKTVMNRRVQAGLLVIALGLLADITIERHSERVKTESAETTKSALPNEPAKTLSAAPSPRLASSTGDQSPAIAGDGNSVQYGDGSLNKKQPPKSSTATSTAH